MKTSEIRQKFINFFEGKGHKRLPSSSLVLANDPTLLFANAGMNQFKDAFTGKENPASKRVVTVQKVVRAGGKHNDLENVGFTSRHHTFFEMLGNFSFGDYFKKEAIAMAWEFLTQELKIPKEKLYISVHTSDSESADIWHKQENVPRSHIFYLGDEDNFWEMGETGPCGPCSEIFYDHGEKYNDPDADTSKCLLNDEKRYVEIWNLVFMQYERLVVEGKIVQKDLPKQCVDTGAGIERISAAMQNAYNNFNTDAFSGLINKIEEISGASYKDHPHWIRVIADHARSTTMLLADGVLPSNEGRGYVLRRIIRRAVRHLDLLNVSKVRFFELASIVFESFAGEYEDNRKNLDFVVKYLKIEEENFRKTLASGLKLLDKEIKNLEKETNNTLSGKSAFTLYDTHGFPVDLTEMILKERSIQIDYKGFEKEMELQKKRSKKTGNFNIQEDNSKEFYAIKESKGDTRFCGFENESAKSKLKGLVDLGDKTALVFEETPFYAEGGGQQGDNGFIKLDGKVIAIIENTIKPVDGIFAHITSEKVDLEINKEYELSIDAENRKYTMSNHTATHLLQAALIKVLGPHVKQAGSSVGPSRLRFDFTHPESVTKDQLTEAQKLVNEHINKKIQVSSKVMTKVQALELGATALFGEKYGNEVRVINVAGFSVELCGGTHVSNTSDIGYFKILSEGSLASGVRRIEAVTNVGAFQFIDERLAMLEEIETSLNVKGDRVLTKLDQIHKSLNDNNKVIKGLKDKLQSMNAQSMFDGVTELKEEMVFKHIEAGQDDDIRKLGDLFIDKFPKGVVLVTSSKGDKVSVLLKTFKGNSIYKCSDILRETATPFGGRGGGKPDMAQGSVDSSQLVQFVNAVTEKLSTL
jgi:alanyl-tRNA synthetase